MQQALDCSPEITELAKALLNVQRVIQPATKDSTNPFTKSTYASLKSVMDTCRQALLDNGIWLCQYPVPVETPGSIGLMTKLTHAESGQWQSSLSVVPLPKADPQGMGSAITYSRRYALTAMLGMVTEDDDGESAKLSTQSKSSNKAAPTNIRKGEAKRLMPKESAANNTSDPRLPKLDGVTFQLTTAQDGRTCIIATGNTQPNKNTLREWGFFWNAQRKFWWKYADAA